MESGIVFRKAVDTEGSLVYQYEDRKNPRIRGTVECMESDLYSDLMRQIDHVRNYLSMAFLVAEEQRNYFDASTSEAIAKTILGAMEKRIESVLEMIEKKTGQIVIVEANQGDHLVEENQVVDVHFKGER